jgi:hypothetical protein
MTDSERARIEELTARLDALERAAPPTIEGYAYPAAGSFPSQVVAGELIESAWGNRVVEYLQGVRIDGGHAFIAPHQQPTPGTVLHVAVSPTLPYSTRMFTFGYGEVGSDSSNVAYISGGIQTQVSGTNGQGSNNTQSIAGSHYGAIHCVHSWVVPAGGSPQFAISANWAGGYTGTIYTAAQVIWQRYRL